MDLSPPCISIAELDVPATLPSTEIPLFATTPLQAGMLTVPFVDDGVESLIVRTPPRDADDPAFPEASSVVSSE